MSTKAPARVDWDALFAEFVAQDETDSAQTFLRDVKGWDVAKVTNGNTLQHTGGWRNQRAKERQEINEAKKQAAFARFEELIPEISAAKREIFRYYLKVLQDGYEEYETEVKGKLVKKTRKLSLRDRSHILTKLKTELGEPAVITKTNTEDVGEHKDPALAVLIAMGIMTPDGKYNIDLTSAQGNYDPTAQSNESAPS